MNRKTAAGASAAVAALGAAAAFLWRRQVRLETDRLAGILDWRSGVAVADVGAGSGRLTLAAARGVGPLGHVFATETDPKKLNVIRRRASKHQLTNITVLLADNQRTALPSACCDSILLRGSYHHFTSPPAITRSLYQALRPGGVIALIEFPPRRWLTLLSPLPEVPANRGGHGIPRAVLIREMTAAGFELHQSISRWFLDFYCVVFRKPD